MSYSQEQERKVGQSSHHPSWRQLQAVNLERFAIISKKKSKRTITLVSLMSHCSLLI